MPKVTSKAHVAMGGPVPASASRGQDEGGEGEGVKGMCQFSFKDVSKMLAPNTPTHLSLASTLPHGCTSHRASIRLVSGPGNQVPGKSRVSITEDKGNSDPGAGKPRLCCRWPSPSGCPQLAAVMEGPLCRQTLPHPRRVPAAACSLKPFLISAGPWIGGDTPWQGLRSICPGR